MIGRVVLDGRDAFALTNDGWEAPLEKIVAGWIMPATLQVEDAVTGTALSNVEVLECYAEVTPQGGESSPNVARSASGSIPLPGRPLGSETLALNSCYEPQSAESVAFIDWLNNTYYGDAKVLPYWVRSPGYAWKRIEVDVSRGGVRRVALQRSCEIEIEIRDRLNSNGLRIELIRSGTSDDAALFWPKPGVPFRIESLPPGKYSVLLAQEARPQFGRMILARNEVTLRAGATEHVSFLRSR
jgi:hypothetical protein